MFDKSAHRRIDRLEEANARLLGHVGEVNLRVDSLTSATDLAVNERALRFALDKTSDPMDALAIAACFVDFLRGEPHLEEETS